MLETLESRQLLAVGPQLIGIQPNEGQLIENGTVLETSPRELVFRFNEGQSIDLNTVEAIEISRAGPDGLLNTGDDVSVQPGFVALGENGADNEVVVRFAETLPDDTYQINVFGFDDAEQGIVGLRNSAGELLNTGENSTGTESFVFDLRLGALIEAVVPQPVIRNEDGSLTQNRNEIVVFFNDDALFVEDESASGSLTIGSETLSINAEVLTGGAFDDVNVVFTPSTGLPSGVLAEASLEGTELTVAFDDTATFGDIADAISSVDAYTATISAGDAGATFVAPAGGATLSVTGNPSLRSVENPRFFQLLLTQDTVRTTDDALFFPELVVYDAGTNTARLIFSDDLNELEDPTGEFAGVGPGGGTFRLRVGTAVDDRVDLILPPIRQAATSLGIDNFQITFSSTLTGDSTFGGEVLFEDSGVGGLTVDFGPGGDLLVDFGGDTPTVGDLEAAITTTPEVQDEVTVAFEFGGIADAGAGLTLPASLVGVSSREIDTAGEVLETAVDVGVFGAGGNLTSLILSEAISPQPFAIELPGGNDDPGRLELPDTVGNGLLQFVNDNFGDEGADIVDGITEIEFNFNGIFAETPSGGLLNQITAVQIERIREALDLWAESIGVQFRETVDSGITFAVGESAVGNFDDIAGTQLISFGALNATLRIDPTFEESLLVFNNNVNFATDFGENFFRSALTGIAFLLGLEQATTVSPQSLTAFNPAFINASIDTISPAGVIPDLEPVFPSPQDVLLGQFVHRPDSVDIDLFRFEVDLDDPDQLGTLTAETFAERLPDSSSLDTTLTLFQENSATAVSDFGVGTDLVVEFEAVAEGTLGNGTSIDFFFSNRGPLGNDDIIIIQATDNSGNPVPNGILIDLPLQTAFINSVSINDLVTAINNDPFAGSLVQASIAVGDPSTNIIDSSLDVPRIELGGGGLTQLTRNDDFFSEDSQITALIGAGVYFIGVAASGNNTFDPNLAGSSFGGLSQGIYDLSIQFDPQVDEENSIRDLDLQDNGLELPFDDLRENVPGTLIDGDADGVAGGAFNFFFQTRSLNRVIQFGDGDEITAGQTLTLTEASGDSFNFEFVPTGGSAAFGNIPIFFDDGSGIAPPTSAGALALAIDFAVSGSTDITLDISAGDGTIEFSGEQAVSLSEGFTGATAFGRTIFVDINAGPNADGSLENPFNNIANPAVANAFGATLPGDQVRIVGNGGLDGDISTEVDNFSFQVGVPETGGGILRDGRDLEIPMDVTTVIDAGAVFSLRNSRIEAGSSNLLEDRSGSVLQVLGTPRLVQLSPQGEPITTTLIGNDDGSDGGFRDGSVIFTSTRDSAADASTAVLTSAPQPGDFGGLVFRRDVDLAAGRTDLEDEGIFLQVVNNADIRFGGGNNVLIDSIPQLVNPVQVFDFLPTISFNEITFSADAAISASPNSFEQISFLTPEFQAAGAFTPDFDRIGPDIFGNRLVDNSINALFIRTETSPSLPPQELSVTGRFDDTDIVHFISENLVVSGTPGGSIQDGIAADLTTATLAPLPSGSLPAGTFSYILTFVDANGFESLPSAPSTPITVADGSSVQLFNISDIPVGSDFVARRLYRLDPASGDFLFAGTIEVGESSFIDDGTVSGAALDLSREGIRGRLDASLTIDPGTVLRLVGSRIEIEQGAQLLAEGTAEAPIIFTSFADDRFGAGGTFDTNNDANVAGGGTTPQRGDFSGIFAAANSFVSLDFATVAFGGGISLLEGGVSRGFAPLELQQADARITNSTFEFNDDGQEGGGPAGREGRLTVTPSTIFARGTQPVIVNNTFIDNRGSTIDIDSDSFGSNRLIDLGRQTGPIDRFSSLDDNFGPLVRLNRFDNVPSDAVTERQVSGLEIRGGLLSTETIFDDTDIAHLLFDAIEVGNVNSSGGLRLLSRADESLVVLLSGPGSPVAPGFGTGLFATGAVDSITDRIGGSLQVLGQPGAPVIISSFNDDSIGAGLTPSGELFTDINGDGFGSRPRPNDFEGILLDQFSNDRNVDVILEQTISTLPAPGLNGTIENAQFLGSLAPNQFAGDDTFRLGFEVEGFISAPNDVDTFSFTGEAGTRVFVDIDRTTFTLDSVIELLDADGNVLARSDNSFDEIVGTPLQDVDDSLAGSVEPLRSGPEAFLSFGAGGLPEDFGSINPRDAGLQVSLPGVRGASSVYFLRVRSASVNPDDVDGGLTTGGYRLQIRLQEEQEFPGSVVRFADIRFADQGIRVRGLNSTSPLLGEAQENENAPLLATPVFGVDPAIVSSNDSIESDPDVPGQRAQFLGNLLASEDGVLSVGGALSTSNDIDFFQIDVDGGQAGAEQFTAAFDIDFADGFNRPDTTLVIFFDPDGEFGPQQPELVFIGEASNVLDDQAQPVSSDPIDLLSRGSIADGDPFIGPVALVEGTYFVGVVGEGVTPAALDSITTRREPIESILRIFDDNVESSGTNTALPPVNSAFAVLPDNIAIDVSGLVGATNPDSDLLLDQVAAELLAALETAVGDNAELSVLIDPTTGGLVVTDPGVLVSVTGSFFTLQPIGGGLQAIVPDTSQTMLVFDTNTNEFLVDDQSFEIDSDTTVSIELGPERFVFELDVDGQLAPPIALADGVELSPGVTVTTAFNTNIGRSSRSTFSGTRTFADSAPSVQFETPGLGGTFLTAQDITPPGFFFSLADDPNIGASDTFGGGIVNTSTTIPHTTINGTTINDVVDIFSFTVLEDDSTVILDIDGGFNPLSGFAIPGTPPDGSPDVDDGVLPVDPTSVDLQLQLFTVNGAGDIVLVATDSFSSANDGALGSQPDLSLLGAELFSTSDPFIELTLDAGQFFVAVSPEATTFDPTTNTFDIADDLQPTSGTYQLQVSIENALVDIGNPGDLGVQLDRSVDQAIFRSSSFSLAGFAAADLPQFYFEYLFDPAIGDTVTLQAQVGTGPGATTITLEPGLIADGSEAGTDGIFRQSIVSLAELAGESEIVLEFVYNTNSVIAGANGLILDDFVIGFAERGELISSAPSGVTALVGSSTTPPGEFQLEIRPATDFTTPTAAGLVLTNTFSTNARQNESATIVAPFLSRINDGDSFVLGDGFNTVTFEFDIEGSGTPGVTPGAIAIPIAAGATRVQIADAIRTAINLPVVQAVLEIQASDSTGSATGGNGDTLVVLSGPVFGDFLELASIDELPPETSSLSSSSGDFLLPVLFSDGFGDQNADRTQSQIVIESNVISNVGGVGILSEPGDRMIDPEDPTGPFLQSPPVGRSTLGAVRNLPILNEEVLGGFAPGVVIRNNTIDSARLAGIQVAGEGRPFVIDSLATGFDNLLFGDSIADGLTLTIDAADTRVTFEFEDLAGSPGPVGSGAVGGDGFADGHVPIFFRRTTAAGPAHSRQEVMLAIFEAIQGSILVDNGLISLVTPTLGQSLQTRDPLFDSIFFNPFGGVFAGNTLGVVNGAVYLEGVTNIIASTAFQDPLAGLGSPFSLIQAPIADAPQPVARIINNTIFGEDGSAALFPEDADSAPNDLIPDAVNTFVGRAQQGPFIDTGAIDTLSDVDIFRVNLDPGDRLTADIDTLPGGPDTVLRVFDSSGREVAFNQAGAAPNFLETNPGAPLDGPLGSASFDVAQGQDVDPFIDFTTLVGGTFFVSVSSAGNETFDPFSVSGRDGVATGGTGAFTIGLEVFAPRTFVLSIDDQNLAANDGNNGTTAPALFGTTFTVTQIADIAGTGTNRQTFEFSNGVGGQQFLGNGNVNVPLLPNFGVPEIINAITNAFNATGIAAPPPLINQAFGNGPNGESGPIGFVTAEALGGFVPFGVGSPPPGLQVFPPSRDSAGPNGFDRPVVLSGTVVGSGPVPGSTTSGVAGTQLFSFIDGAAEIEISPEATAGGLRLDPEPGANLDQVLPETGILLTGGSSGTVVNNVLFNLQQGVVVEQTSTAGFFPFAGNTISNPADVVVTANVFQNISNGGTVASQDNQVLRENASNPFGPGGNIGITPGPSNVNGGTDDFNITLPGGAPLFINPEGGDFLPAIDSVIVDSAINSITDRDLLSNIRTSVGLPVSNILAPDFDVNGVIRADNPDAAPAVGLGASIFRDRGSNELADFVGPVATLVDPLDNDPEGIDTDVTENTVVLAEGPVTQFQIQLRDTGDASDPFNGLGLDADTVLVAPIADLRAAGANITVFENEVLLTEGIDYSISFDETQSIITITPLAGIFPEENSYRISLNNQDRTVLVVPDAEQVTDGEQIEITNLQGGTIVFEFEFGFSLFVPDPITLIAPPAGVGGVGVNDGEIFTINDGVNSPVIFEFTLDDLTLPGTIPVSLPIGSELADQPADIAANIAAAITAQVQAGLLDVDVNLDGDRVVLGTEAGATATTSASGLLQPVRTLALQVPTALVGAVGGIVDGDTFVINDGAVETTFEFNTGGLLSSADNAEVTVNVGDEPQAVIGAILAAIAGSALTIDPFAFGTSGQEIFLALPVNGNAEVSAGLLSVVGLSRTPQDGETLQVNPNDGGPSVTIELNRTDDPNAPIDVEPPTNLLVDFDRSTTAVQLAESIELVLEQIGETVSGLGTSLSPIIGGGIAIGGDAGLTFDIVGSSLQLQGEPAVESSSTIEVFGPLNLTLPAAGGISIANGSILVIDDLDGNPVVFEFRIDSFSPVPDVPGAIAVVIPTLASVEEVQTALIDAINAFGFADIVASAGAAPGQVSFGAIDEDRVLATGGVFNGVFAPGLLGAFIGRSIVDDGEVLTIGQGPTQVSFEFESLVGGGGVADGNIPVLFSPGSTSGTVAQTLAASINNNLGGLVVNAVAVLGDDGLPTGVIELNDVPGTLIDVSASPTLLVSGVPGGAIPIPISPFLPAELVVDSFVNAINGLVQPGLLPSEQLLAQERGGGTIFISGATTFSGPIENFFVPAIADLAGNPLEANTVEGNTEFTLLLPGVGLDFGDAPDPFLSEPGRFPTLLASDGPRNVIDGTLFLGSTVDADVDGNPTATADGDDFGILIESAGPLFTTTVVDGVAEVGINVGAINVGTTQIGGVGFVFTLGTDAFGIDSENTVTIDTGVAQATLEFDINGRFDEDNFAINAGGTIGAVSEVIPGVPGDDPTLEAEVLAAFLDAVADSLATAIVDAIDESPLVPASVSLSPTQPGTVLVSGDDEDGVSFISDVNPTGLLNASVPLPITVTVSDAGVLEGFIDFNADGDFDDPGEQVIPQAGDGAESNLFGAGGGTRTFIINVPATVPEPVGLTETVARFRVSREGDLGPDGLGLSGETEDFVLTLVPGAPPTVGDLASRTFTVAEDNSLQALDATGLNSPATADDGLLVGITDPDGDQVEIFAGDTGLVDVFEVVSSVVTTNVVGQAEVFDDGRFIFTPIPDFSGEASFSVRVAEVDPEAALVSPVPIDVTINVTPINDAPVANVTPISISRNIDEDEVAVFTVDDLTIDAVTGQPLFSVGPPNEAGQTLAIGSLSSPTGTPFQTALGGSLQLVDGNVIYTPPANFSTPAGVSDSFNFTIFDVLEDGSLGLESSAVGLVEITINGLNDPPIVVDDLIEEEPGSPENGPIIVPLNGVGGILTNDLPGPIDEIDAGQTISLVTTPFPLTTEQGGTVILDNGSLRYERPFAGFEGIDSFEYTVIDSLGATATGTVTIDLIDDNDAPVFVGVDGQSVPDGNGGSEPLTVIELQESSPGPQSPNFNLLTFFNDPEGDPLTFSVSSLNPSLVSPVVDGAVLTLNIPAFAFGTAVLTIEATDTAGLSTSQNISVNVAGVPNIPIVQGGAFVSLDANEDNDGQGPVTADLGGVFFDPDGDNLFFTVVSVDGVFSPSPAEIAANPLLESIEFVGDEIQIELAPDQSGSVEITIGASDAGAGFAQVTHTFTLNVAPVPDAPVAVADQFSVPVGAVLSVSDPAFGLLGNDIDPDGDTFSVDVDSIAGQLLDNLTVNPDGTFVFESPSGLVPNTQDTLFSVGDTFVFSYQLVDTQTGELSNIVNFSFTLSESIFQNPIAGLAEDVNADGVVSPLDALLVINFLLEQPGGLPVDGGDGTLNLDIGTAPPNFVDVNGDGRVTPLDALNVINRLTAAPPVTTLSALSVDEPSVSALASSAATTSFAAASSVGLPVRQIVPVSAPVDPTSPVASPTVQPGDDERDQILTAGLEIDSGILQSAVSELSQNATNDPVSGDFDEALLAMLSDDDPALLFPQD